MMKPKRAIASISILALVALLPGIGAADEPFNNDTSWSSSKNTVRDDLTVFSFKSTGTAGWNGFESITTSDVDYLIMTCGGSRDINGVGIDFTHSQGDLDISVYRPDGTYLGGSYSTTDDEWFYPSAGEDVLVMRVYGYSGATASYGVRLSC